MALVRNAFFRRQSESSKVWICRSGATRKLKGTSYSNAVTHVRTDHPNEYEFSGNSTAENNCTMPKSSTLFYKRKTTQVFGWIEFIVYGMQPFSVVENPTFRKQSRFDSISCDTLAKYLEGLTSIVEDKITQLLPQKFAVVFDGWSCGDTHDVAIYASFPYNNQIGYRKVLLGFSPFEEETSQCAQQHYKYLKFVLSTFKKSIENVVVLIGDNCNTNTVLADKAGISFLGCASHRFNLAMKDKLEMAICKLQDGKRVEQLETVALKSFELEQPAASPSDTEELLSLAARHLSAESSNIKKVHYICKELGDLNSVTNSLQAESVTLSDVRTCLVEVIREHPGLTAWLSATADIVKDPVLDMAICKLQDGKRLEKLETVALKSFELEQPVASPSDTEELLSLAAMALKRRKLQH